MTAVAAPNRRILLVASCIAVTALVAARCLAQAPQRNSEFNIAAALTKNALTAVNHANLTGNYTVLRDLGTPSFRDRNSAAQLATIFQKLRDQKVDLSPVLSLDPQFSAPPRINEAGLLELVGSFPTQPLEVRFQLGFAKVNGGWSIETISIAAVNTQPPPQNSSASNGIPSGPISLAPPQVDLYVR